MALDVNFISLSLGLLFVYLKGLLGVFVKVMVMSITSDAIGHWLVMLNMCLQVGFSLHLYNSSARVSVVIVAIVQLQTLGTREMEWLAQGHTARVDSDTCVLNHA